MKKALLLCASHNDLGLMRALTKLGMYIIVTGNVEGLPGERYADKFIKADYSDKELILKIAREEKIDYIIPCCHDYGVYTASYVAEKMNLPGHDSYETTLLIHNKDKFNELAKELGIKSPSSKMFNEKSSAEKYLSSCEYPIIMKPVDAAGGKGVNKAINFDEAVEYLNEAFDKSKAGRIVIEPYIEGKQYGFCTFLRDQKVVACIGNNEYSIMHPYRVEIDTFPSDNFEEVKDELIEQVEKIADKLKLKDGIFHMQYIVKDKIIHVIEVMRRILGNMYFIPANATCKGGGIDWEYWEVRARCGLSCQGLNQSLQAEGYYAYKMILANQNGVIKKITIPKVYDKYLMNEFWLKEVGEEITHHSSEPLGFLFFMFKSQEEMHKVLIEDYRNDLAVMEVSSDE